MSRKRQLSGCPLAYSWGDITCRAEIRKGVILLEKLIIGGKYRHFKGNEYRALHLAKHSETLEYFVVYQALYGECGIWVRPLEMFLGFKETDGVLTKRFQAVDE